MNAPVAAKKPTQRSQSANTPECRIAHMFFHEKRTQNAAKQPLKTPRYDGVFLLPKITNDPATCPNYKFLSDMCMEAAGKMWPGAGWPAGGIWPVKDGDVPYIAKPKPGIAPKTAEQVAAANAWRVGHWVIEATNFLSGPKVVVMQNGVAVEIPAKVIHNVVQYKSGDYGIGHISAYAYENEQWGCNFSVEGVLFTRPGELIGNGPRSASQMFGGVAGTVASMGPVAPGTAAAPAAPGAPPMPPVSQGYVAPAPTAAAPQPPAPTAAVAPPMPPSPPLAPAAPTYAPPGPPMPPVPGASLPSFPQPH